MTAADFDVFKKKSLAAANLRAYLSCDKLFQAHENDIPDVLTPCSPLQPGIQDAIKRAVTLWVENAIPGLESPPFCFPHFNSDLEFFWGQYTHAPLTDDQFCGSFYLFADAGRGFMTLKKSDGTQYAEAAPIPG